MSKETITITRRRYVINRHFGRVGWLYGASYDNGSQIHVFSNTSLGEITRVIKRRYPGITIERGF